MQNRSRQPCHRFHQRRPFAVAGRHIAPCLQRSGVTSLAQRRRPRQLRHPLPDRAR